MTTYREMKDKMDMNESVSELTKAYQKIRTVYPIHIVNSLGGFLNYHQGKQQWKLNTSKY